MKPLVYCGQKADLELITNNQLDVIFFGCNNDLSEYFSASPSKDHKPFYDSIWDYERHYLETIAPKLEKIKAKEIVVAGDLNYWNLMMIAKTLLSIHPKVYGCFIEPEPFESQYRYLLAHNFLLYNMPPCLPGVNGFSGLRIISRKRDGIMDSVSIDDFNKYRYEQLFYYLNNYDDIRKGLKPGSDLKAHPSYKRK